jgi:hypothetical protein
MSVKSLFSFTAERLSGVIFDGFFEDFAFEGREVLALPVLLIEGHAREFISGDPRSAGSSSPFSSMEMT